MNFCNKIFVIIIFIILLSFSCFRTSKTVSFVENRNLAQYPSYKLYGELNYNFFKQYDKWFVDHIRLRDFLIKCYLAVENKFSSKGDSNVIIGKNNWLFRNNFGNDKNFNNLDAFRRKIILDETFKYKASLELKKVSDYALKNNVKVYLIIPPTKHIVYEQFLPKGIIKSDNPYLSEQIEPLVPKNIKVIRLEDIFIQEAAKNEKLIYFKTDTHWTETGAYLAYQILMKNIKENFPSLKMPNKNDYNITYDKKIIIYEDYIKDYASEGNLNQMLGKSGFKGDILYEQYHHKNKNKLKVLDVAEHFQKTNFPDGNNLKVICFHDSFGHAIIKFIVYGFQDVLSYRINPVHRGELWGIHFRKNVVENKNFKPDIIIFVISDLKLIELQRIWD